MNPERLKCQRPRLHGNLLVRWASAQGSVGKAPHVRGHVLHKFIGAAIIVRFAPSYGLALHAVFGGTQS